MTGPSVLSGGNRRRPGRRRSPKRAGAWVAAALIVVIVAAIVVVAIVVETSGPSRIGSAPARRGSASRHRKAPATRATPKPIGPTVPADYGATLAPPSERVTIHLRAPLQSGELFDVQSGNVLWERDPNRILPIASLTKMMTAIIVGALDPPRAPVLITRAAVHFQGSGVGLLPIHKRVPVEDLLYGLLLPSGNDAAIALAQHAAGDQRHFIAMMNTQAQAMGLGCTHFTTVSGIVDAGNHSCAVDLAKIARALLDEPRLAHIVGSASAILRFPIKGGKLYLYNNNPLYGLGYPGVDGVKTGYTTAAGVCLVATARHGRAWLGVVLLHSGDDIDQAPALLNAGFAALRRG